MASEKNLHRAVSRNPQGYLFRGEENPERPAENGEGGAARLHSKSTRPKPKSMWRGLRRCSKKSTPRPKTCDAIMGIIEEGQEVMKEFKGAPALDAGLLAAAQAVEHYEIARYGTLKTWASELGLNQAVKLLETTLSEEKKTNETLTQLAQSEVNQHAQAA